ncbi:MAG: hypothetical protein SCAL_001118 [Candidatus Syntrophoarchaeum caldarius]|uniref:Uncharacterized protein n=1 Tax=Candidatus Syntropharchaeum caldarium TaxID=1838285 RepID=A0A1F2P979_9EURY|nr:MAG: hypothetical protein SCAL_001118 [Candidatus Syntrophoarchaeum caldarius]
MHISGETHEETIELYLEPDEEELSRYPKPEVVEVVV